MGREVKPVTPTAIPTNATRIVLAKDQPQYEPLPAAISSDGLVMTEWEFSAEDLATVVAGGRLRLWTYTYGHPFQPVQLEVVE